MYLKFIYYLGLKNQVFCYNPGHWSHFCIGTSHCACTCLYSGMRVYISLRNKKNRYVLPLDFCFRYTQSQCYSIRYKNLIKTRHNNVYSDSVMPEPGGPGGPLAPQYLADQLTPFQPGEGRLSPLITTGTSNFFHLLASLPNIRFFFDLIDIYLDVWRIFIFSIDHYQFL